MPLHVFEERYKQLIADCRAEAQTFGIPVYINQSLTYGTEVQLRDVVNTYADGSMDVVCVARQVFEVVAFQPVLGDRLYPGGEVRFLDSVNEAPPGLTDAVIEACRRLYELMDVPFGPIKREVFNSFTLAHKMGLSLQQEYSLLQIPDETRERIEMNGHFRNFDPLDFKDYRLQ